MTDDQPQKPCEHQRADYRYCPHCMGIGSASPKPDTTPREWWIGDSEAMWHVADCWLDTQSWEFDTIHVIEKSAYVGNEIKWMNITSRMSRERDNLVDRVERAEAYVVACASHVESVRLVDERDALKQRVEELEAPSVIMSKEQCSALIKIELAAANEKIKVVQAAEEYQAFLLAQATARIAELEANFEFRGNVVRKLEEREQKLVAENQRLTECLKLSDAVIKKNKGGG